MTWELPLGLAWTEAGCNPHWQEGMPHLDSHRASSWGLVASGKHRARLSPGCKPVPRLSSFPLLRTGVPWVRPVLLMDPCSSALT